MKTNLASMGLSLVLCCACGTDSESPSDGDTPDAGAGGAGGPAAGGAGPGSGGMGTSGGAGGGGGASSGSGGRSPGAGGGGGAGAGGSGFDPADHCGPGEYFREGFLEAELASQCIGAEHDQAIANGIGPGADYVDIWSVRLRTPMGVGETTAYSREVRRFSSGGQADVQIEYWAATDPCGRSGSIERFYAAPVASTDVYCGAIQAAAPYAYILEVSRPLPNVPAVGYQVGGASVCATGTCPTR